jgi:hypothetical protein
MQGLLSEKSAYMQKKNKNKNRVTYLAKSYLLQDNSMAKLHLRWNIP